MKKIYFFSNEFDYNVLTREFKVNKTIDLKKYINEREHEVLKKLKIQVPRRLITEEELYSIEISLLKFIRIDKDNNITFKEELLNKLNVTVKEFEYLNDIIFKIINEYSK